MKVYTKILTAISITFITNNVSAATNPCEAISSNYTNSVKVGGTTFNQLNTLSSYNNKKTGRLYLHPDDCDLDKTNDVNLEQEVVECSGGDTSFTKGMRESLVDSGKVFVSNNGNRDSSVFGGYNTIVENLVSTAQSNSSGRFCKPTGGSGEGTNDSYQYCSELDNIEMPASFTISDLPSAIQKCKFNLDRKIKVGEVVTLSSENFIESGLDEFYSFGFTTLKCSLSQTTGKPYLYMLSNTEPSCNPTDPNSSFYTNAVRECNQICYWGEDLHCPEKTITWGGGNCTYQTGTGFIGEELTVESQTYFNGSVDVKCELGGNWILLNSGSCS